MPENDQERSSLIFQKDNGPCHRAHNCNDWFENHQNNMLKLSANSPDLNSIENLLLWLDKLIQKEEPRSNHHLLETVAKILYNEYFFNFS